MSLLPSTATLQSTIHTLNLLISDLTSSNPNQNPINKKHTPILQNSPNTKPTHALNLSPTKPHHHKKNILQPNAASRSLPLLLLPADPFSRGVRSRNSERIGRPPGAPSIPPPPRALPVPRPGRLFRAHDSAGGQLAYSSASGCSARGRADREGRYYRERLLPPRPASCASRGPRRCSPLSAPPPPVPRLAFGVY